MACKLNVARGGFDDIEKILKDGEVLQIQVNNSIIENWKNTSVWKKVVLYQTQFSYKQKHLDSKKQCILHLNKLL